MGLFSRLFSKANDLPALRKAMAQKRYADALLVSDEIDQTGLTAEECRECEALTMTAGDTLAEMNLNEGLFLLRDDQVERATDHLQLAQQQAVSAPLQTQIANALSQLENTLPEMITPTSDCSSCTSCAPKMDDSVAQQSEGDHPDLDSQIDLILVSYPPEFTHRYQDKSGEFKQAFLLSHQGDEAAALKKFEKISADERDDLYDFEVGSILGRQGNVVSACKALESAVQKNPAHLLAVETWVMLLIAQQKIADAVKLVEAMLAKQQSPAFCHAQLASIYHVQNNDERALDHGQQAIAAGQNDPRILLMTATLLEKDGQLDEAEALYRQLPSGGGCGGGINLYLAEFFLRQRRELRKLVDTFNNACKQEPDNPRWQLRKAQTYLARGWDKQGLSLLETVVRDPRLSEELRHEGETLLAQH